MWELIPAIAVVAVILALYVHDVSKKLIDRYFEIKNRLLELEGQITSIKISDESPSGDIENVLRRINDFKGRLKSIEDEISEIKRDRKILGKKLESLEESLRKQSERVENLEREVFTERDKLKKELKRELLYELEEEIERLEEAIEKRKNEEVEEFLEVIKAAITLQPEKLKNGLEEAKRGLLSLRDIAKVYVLTGKGQEEFQELKKNLVELLKNLRKLAVVSLPEEWVYSRFNDIIVAVKRLDIPIKKDGRELPPERSFIEIHRTIFEISGELDELAEKLGEPVPVTPIEKEFYEKLRRQFEELRKLEEQVQKLMLKLNVSPDEKREKDMESILRELDIL
ncbi:hypothetical protein [Thermococcus sp.]|uniref:hypothetical protein n=1 Tax=Thermococcus sp. TaxID=35749 RepID=UPI00260F0DFD|nr:hypothetical protein [Thermococcus sp.]